MVVNFEEKLNIRTQALREWKEDVPYNRNEPTPYEALEELFKIYTMAEDAQFVDVGAGSGRVAFYVNDRFDINVRGLELNELTLDEALLNQTRYNMRDVDLSSNIVFEFGYAETYEIKEKDNVFFFFNPFKVKIFKKVIKNIVDNANDLNKEVDILIYYGIKGYLKHLSKIQGMELVNRSKIEGIADPKAEVFVYRYTPQN